ncbi:MAG TPA: FtsQ-type POTRA domain-containing protein, partial [Chloroflexota bacterium]
MARSLAAQRRVRPARRPATAAERAVRAATPREPLLPVGFLSWALARAMGLGLLVLAGWVVYDSASSDRFQVRSVRVKGQVLLNRTEVESVAAVTGANVFWVDREQVAARLRNLPLVQRVDVGAMLPDTVEISI